MRTTSRFLGSHHTGREAIAAAYLPLFRKLLKGTRLRIDITQVRFLTPDVALLHADAAVVRRRRNRRKSRVNTSVAVRADGRWLLVASQNTTRRRFAETLISTLFS